MLDEGSIGSDEDHCGKTGNMAFRTPARLNHLNRVASAPPVWDKSSTH